MSLCDALSSDLAVPLPLKWSPSGFTYLGIKISPKLDLYKLNFSPVIRSITNEDRRCSLPLSLLGRIHLVKMNIVPRLLYLFQMLPVLLPGRALRQIRQITFIWRKKRSIAFYHFLVDWKDWQLPHLNYISIAITLNSR